MKFNQRVSLLKHDQMWSNPHKLLKSADSFNCRHKQYCTNRQCNLYPHHECYHPLSCAMNSSSKKLVAKGNVSQCDCLQCFSSWTPAKIRAYLSKIFKLMIDLNFHQVRQVVLWISLDKSISPSQRSFGTRNLFTFSTAVFKSCAVDR